MGTWGYNPKDGDGPHDSVSELMVRGITLELITYFEETPKTTSDYWEHLGVVQLLSEYHYKIPFSVLKKCLDYLNICLTDKNWIQTWKHPNVFETSAHDFQERLFKIIRKAETPEGLQARKRGMGIEFDLVETSELMANLKE